MFLIAINLIVKKNALNVNLIIILIKIKIVLSTPAKPMVMMESVHIVIQDIILIMMVLAKEFLFLIVYI